MEQAHKHAQLAESAEHDAQQAFIRSGSNPLPVMERVIHHHMKAAEYFLKAATSHDNPDTMETSLVQSGHQQAIHTLQLLSAHHSKQAQEWKRRAQQLQQLPEQPAPEQPAPQSIPAQQDEEPIQDPFNKFWDVVENLVSTDTSRTVAFTTAPTKFDSPSRPMKSTHPLPSMLDESTHQMLQSYYVVPGGNQWAASTIIPSPTSSRKPNDVSAHDKPPASPTKTLEELKLENEQLRNIVDLLSKKLAILEKTAQENQVLKTSIIRFRNDVQKQAKRFGGASTSQVMSSAGHLQQSEISSATSKRTKELEDQVEWLKREIEKKDIVLEKYQERWEKLKEAAKKKRQEIPAE